MKSRLRQPPLPQMEFPFAGKQTLAEHFLGADKGTALGEVLLVGDENVADQIRVIEEVNPLVTDPEEHDVAVARGRLDEERQAPPRELEDHVSRKPRARARRVQLGG